jgi:hypothetical protein
VKQSTKGHNSVKFGCSKHSFLYCHLHIKVVNPWKFRQNLPSGLRGVEFTNFYIVYNEKIKKGHNSLKFGCRKNSFLYYHLHIKVLYPWFKQNLPSGLRGVASTKFRDGLTDGLTSATPYAPTLWGHKNSPVNCELLGQSLPPDLQRLTK